MKTTYSILFTVLQALAPVFGWQNTIQTNEFNDAITYYCITTGRQYKAAFQQSVPSLTVRLEPRSINRTADKMEFAQYCFITLPHDVIESRTILARIDKQQAITITGTISTDHRSIFIPAEIIMDQFYKPHKRILFRIVVFGGRTRDISFSTDAIRPALIKHKRQIMAAPPPGCKVIE